MTYVEKISIYYDTINCVKHVVATEPKRIYGKDILLLYIR